MGDVISLRLARKAQTRKAAEEKAAENRVRFGQTKSEKQLRKAEATRIGRQLDAGKLATGKLDPEKS